MRTTIYIRKIYSIRMKSIAIALAAALLCCCTSGVPELNYMRLNAEAEKEYQTPLRPYKEGVSPCWNTYAKDFKFAPVFDFKKMDGAAKYRYTVWQDSESSYFWTTPMQQRPDNMFPKHQPTDTTAGFFTGIDITAPSAVSWSFVAKSPNESLAPIWRRIPVGNSRLIVEAMDESGKVLGVVGDRLFIRDFPFEGPYPEAPRPYRECAVWGCRYVHTMPAIQSWLTSAEPDMSYRHNTYPCKIIGATIRIELLLAKLAPSMADECLTIAKNAASFLIAQSQPDSAVLAYFPPTYYKKLVASANVENQGTTMMMEASSAAQAFLDLYDYTGEKQYFDHAIGIAETYRRIQNEDGSYPVKVYLGTGEASADSHAMLHPLLMFLQRLHNQYGIDDFLDTQSRGENWMHSVAVRKFDMHGQFEDVSVLGWKPYMNLTNSTSGPYASYLLRKDVVSDEDMKDVNDLMHLCEDQFVHWNALPNRDGFRQIPTPGVYEQYEYRVPIDNSNCNVANAWLDMYERNGDELAFAKAKALVDAIANVQNKSNGRIETTWDMRSYKSDAGRAFWINCSLASVQIFMRMAELTGEL